MKKRRKWTKEEMIAEFFDYKNKGGDIRGKTLHKEKSALYTQIYRKFGSYEEFLIEVGLDFEKMHGQKSYRLMNKKDIIEYFKKIEKEGYDIRSSSLQKSHSGFFKVIKKNFESYENFLKEINYDYKEIHGIRFWNKELIIDEFYEHYDAGQPINSRYMQINKSDLYHAITNHYIGYKEFIELLGLNYEEISKKKIWTEEDIIKEFKMYVQKERILKAGYMQRNGYGYLHFQILKKFRSYEAFLEQMGFDYFEIHHRRTKWSEKDIKEEFEKTRDELGTYQYSAMRVVNQPLTNAINNMYGGYRKFLNTIGIDYDNLLEEQNYRIYAGNKFQKLVEKMFKSLNLGYENQYRGFKGVIPDFYDKENDIILDAKLSSWTVFVSDTIEKYIDLSNKLIIIYLRGHDIEHNIDKMKLIPIDSYYPVLKKAKLFNIIKEMENLKEKTRKKENLE